MGTVADMNDVDVCLKCMLCASFLSCLIMEYQQLLVSKCIGYGSRLDMAMPWSREERAAFLYE